MVGAFSPLAVPHTPLVGPQTSLAGTQTPLPGPKNPLAGPQTPQANGQMNGWTDGQRDGFLFLPILVLYLGRCPATL